ncbi:class I SAM-dependent methyltransferase [Demequina muriae]|uniref:Class I SAM-dependent methyltransferase n=1 Tax=Demequina muriae TaxID=3051664 RepID=A0ABT8GLH4_9MICO|nr:class I SAM-dependent methyltransferase [Demequina sp. EGI L300058]MDN4481786.1 class I SAM-dependent methyltransferase [Demequina sp. EGI L300058]
MPSTQTTTSTLHAADPDEAIDATAAPTAEEFADRVLTATLGWVEMMSIHLGDQLGWYEVLSLHDSITASELAFRTSSSTRYAHEWLEQQAAYGILAVVETADAPAKRRYALPSGAAEVLTDRRSQAYMAPMARILAAAAAQMPALVDAYRAGTGVSWAQFGDHAWQSQADLNRPWLGEVPTVFARHQRLHKTLSRPGARIADVGTGAGWSAIALAKAYPGLMVEGFDVDAPSIEAARAQADRSGVADRVTFHLADAASLADHGSFDGVVAFECIHDMPDPESVLEAMRRAVTADGFVVVMDEAVAEEFEADAGPVERLMYGFSLFICLPDGLSHETSAATGTVMRPSTLRRYATAAGFSDVSVLEDDFGFWRFYDLHQ